MSTDTWDLGDLTPITIPVTIGGQQYELREATEDAACMYRNRMLGCARMGADGKPTSVDGLADLEPLLVSFCLCDADTKIPVPLETVMSWPARIVRPLFEKAKEISELAEGEDEEDEAKNEQGGTTDTSG